MAGKIIIGVGAHEPIYHRLRTGNSTAEEWARWEQETSDANLDVLEKLGVSEAHLPCTKGFGLEFEKPLIERIARFADRAAKRGIRTSAYVQGFPVYYETFLRETPQAVDWLARNQHGEFIPWGGQTFRRWMDPNCRAFLDYQLKLFDYILDQFHPDHFNLDNTCVAASYTASALAAWRQYLTDRYPPEIAMRQFGIPGFEAVDLPRFDPIYYPIDAFKIVKDPLMQEWAFWRASTHDAFVAAIRDFIHQKAPGVELHTPAGCEGLRYSHLMHAGIHYDGRIAAADWTGMEESGWRPGVIEQASERNLAVIMDERSPDAAKTAEKSALRISTDSRFNKIRYNYGMPSGGGFWGEFDRASKLVALAHALTFASQAADWGSFGPLCAHPDMTADLADAIAWGREHHEVLAGRDGRVAPIAVWRGTASMAFIRHTANWDACLVEQMLYENHYPFTILLDSGLDRFLADREILILPGTECVSDRQVEVITRFVEQGGKLLLLAAAGTRDERTRVRQQYAFRHFFGAGLPSLELIGPPHWVPTLDFSKMPATLQADYGKGRVAFVKAIAKPFAPDLSRDPYMPERQVFVKDIVPPKNEAQILDALDGLYGPALKVDGPRWMLTDYWMQGKNLLVACGNLRKNHDGGPLTIRLGNRSASRATLHSLLEPGTRNLPIEGGRIRIDKVPYAALVAIAP